MSDSVIEAFDIDRSTGSLVVARELDRETQSEYRLEVRALDTSAMNNPQSSAITVRVDIADVNDNAPFWPQDPITITIAEDVDVGSSVYNFTARDVDAGNNGDLRYSLVKQFPNSVFSVDALTGTLILASPLDYEQLQEYTIVVKATDQSTNLTERLSATVTARIVITDSNDNAPKFVLPSNQNVFFSDSVTVGMLVGHVVAVDSDSGDNGRVTYVIASGNEGNHFSLGYDNGIITLAKPLKFSENTKSFTLNISAIDHGTPTRRAHMMLKLTAQGSTENPPRFLNSVYYATVPEDATIGTFVVRVSAKSTMLEGGE